MSTRLYRYEFLEQQESESELELPPFKRSLDDLVVEVSTESEPEQLPMVECPICYEESRENKATRCCKQITCRKCRRQCRKLNRHSCPFCRAKHF